MRDNGIKLYNNREWGLTSKIRDFPNFSARRDVQSLVKEKEKNRTPFIILAHEKLLTQFIGNISKL